MSSNRVNDYEWLKSEVQVRIGSTRYLGHQLITFPETLAQVRLVALIDQVQRFAADPSTGRQYRRLWPPPSLANEMLKWGV